jgi:hypothetical protein
MTTPDGPAAETAMLFNADERVLIAGKPAFENTEILLTIFL